MTDAVFYATKFGASEGAAKYIAGRISADIVDLNKTPDADPKGYGKVVLGCGVYNGQVLPSVTDFVEKHVDIVPSFDFFLVCALKDKKADEQLEKIAKKLGVGYHVYFNSPRNMAGVEGSKLELFIEHLNNGI